MSKAEFEVQHEEEINLSKKIRDNLKKLIMKNKPVKEIVIYQANSGKIEFRGDLERDTVWGTQKQIADLFSIDRTVATRHINKILKEGEVNEKSNVHFLHIANSDKPVKFYSLDIILAVGYRTNSSEAITFRKWATKTLKQHLLKGYTINKNRIAGLRVSVSVSEAA